MRSLRSVEWRDGALRLIDQRQLPNELVFERCEDVESVARAIRELRVRGAPALGATGAYGVVLAAQRSRATSLAELRRDVGAAAEQLRATRPTAVNLGWAIDRQLAVLDGATDAAEARVALLANAHDIAEADVAACDRMGEAGADLIPADARVLTHCNTGLLATVGCGTALSVIKAAHARGRVREVLVDETRPLLQGARLTAWELRQQGIPCRLIVDSAAGHYMARGQVDAVVVGADRIAANGDVANKIGTYTLAILAHAHEIPFFVAAPTSTLDFALASGDEIAIEERGADEVTTVAGRRMAPEGVAVGNPAFDVTPARYVSAIVTEAGVARAPYEESLRALLREPALASA